MDDTVAIISREITQITTKGDNLLNTLFAAFGSQIVFASRRCFSEASFDTVQVVDIQIASIINSQLADQTALGKEQCQRRKARASRNRIRVH